MNSPERFQEQQRMRQWWLIAIVIGVAVLGWYFLIEQIVRGNDVGSNPGPDWVVVLLWLLTGIGMPVFFWWFKLDTRVDNDGIHITMAPFSNRTIERSDIDKFGSRTYKPILEFGGWGVRGFGSNRAYNINGNRGVQLELTNGDRILIGSQRPGALEAAIAAMTRVSPTVW